MLARIRSAAVLGVEAYLMDVEVDIASGMPSFSTVGLPHGAVKEGRERVSTALANAGFCSAPAHHGEPGPGRYPQGRNRRSTSRSRSAS